MKEALGEYLPQTGYGHILVPLDLGGYTAGRCSDDDRLPLVQAYSHGRSDGHHRFSDFVARMSARCA